MTFGEQKAEVARRLAEVNGRVFWSDADIATSLNLGYMEASDETEWYEQVVDVSLLNDRPLYDLWTLVGPSFLALKPTFDYQTNRWLIPSVIRQLDVHDRRWERVTGEPQRVFLRGLRWMGLWPRIQADVGTIKVYHTALPPPLVDDDDTPGFPDTFHYILVDFALADLFSQDAETPRTLAAWAAYLAGEAELQAWVDHRAGGATMGGFEAPGVSIQR